MPSNDFRFNEADAAAVIAYLRSIPPVDREQPAASIGPVARALSLFTAFPLVTASKIDHATVAFNAASGVGTDPVTAGKYLVASAGCHGCHGPELKGGGGPPPGAANITPVGIGNWSEQDFFTALREHKRPNGLTIDDAMPRGYGQMADEDLRKIFSYLKTVPPAGEKSKNQAAVASSRVPASEGNRRVAVALVPPDQMTPPEFQYSDRSTKMGTLLVTAITLPNDSFESAGTRPLTNTLNRDVGGTV
jgi:mono/diheme cytochrome c family protein